MVLVLTDLCIFRRCNVSFCGEFQPSDRISKVLFGGQVTDEEAESLLKRLDLALNLGFSFLFLVK